MNFFIRIKDLMLRELRILSKNHIYGFCMVVFPLLTMVFFTTFLDEGLPEDMPIGVVDLDNSHTSRSLVRTLDAFQNSKVVARYPSVSEARCAMQENKIYAFLYIPKGLSEKLLSGRQPKVSYYYSMTCMTAGSLTMKDLKTISTLGSASVGQATLSGKGLAPEQIQSFLQPIRIDTHQIGNPEGSYNVYLTTALVPGIMMLFMMLLSAYSLGMELKFDTGKEWLQKAGGNIVVAIIGKFLIHTLVFLTVVLLFQYYIYNVLHFPRMGSVFDIVRLCLLQVIASIGFGIFAFGLMPSLRMSMSICSLWAVLSISMAGSAFPVMAMDPPLQSLSWLFPLRHYFMLYQVTVFNGFPLIDAWFHLVALVAFTLLPWFVVKKIKNAMLTYVYIP
ncbi:MAG: ABC transporter permease [Prevotella sp.]|nr:ABC transporter permease [Prevotella sp.]MBQ4295219.1 ABC transporter permease [Prevotella sp.]MBR7053236.1 ABC transporter permease [Prevotella sp.]